MTTLWLYYWRHFGKGTYFLECILKIYLNESYFTNNYNPFPISIKKTDFYRVLKDY